MDVSTWPLSPAVVATMEAAREAGRPVGIVSGAPLIVVERVAERLGGLSFVMGTDRECDLTGERKAAALVVRFGTGGFDYVGDAPADIPVWKAARHGLAVRPSGRLLRRTRALGRAPKVIERSAPWDTWRALLRAMRPHQWAKNVLVLAPVVAAHAIFQAAAVTAALGALVAFCLIASGTYLINDLLDLESDRRHSRKRNRPLASGRLPLPWGMAAAVSLLAAGAGAAAALSSPAALSLLLYVVVSLLYSLRLKRVAALDVMVLAALYTMRILVGSFAAGIPLSHWFLAFSVFLFCSLAFVKRAAELRGMTEGAGGTIHGRGYGTEDLNAVLALGAASGFTAVLVLALYATSQEVARLYRYPTTPLLLCPLLMYWMSRMWLITLRGQMHDDPIAFSLRDRASWLVGAIAAVLLVLAS